MYWVSGLLLFLSLNVFVIIFTEYHLAEDIMSVLLLSAYIDTHTNCAPSIIDAFYVESYRISYGISLQNLLTSNIRNVILKLLHLVFYLLIFIHLYMPWRKAASLLCRLIRNIKDLEYFRGVFSCIHYSIICLLVIKSYYC